jgi:Cobalamin biosynthesis protein CobN and related Mg-chelatases
MGDALLARYLKDEGKYPENIGMVVWATDTMRTKGEDVAEILYLLGTRPIWEKTSGRVTGVEVIPADKLNHPRIDVTVRISGLFRDTFSRCHPHPRRRRTIGSRPQRDSRKKITSQNT